MSGIALKLTALLVRTISKPISKAISTQAKNNETFRKYCISFANKLHKTDVKLRMNLLGEKKIRVRPLNDNKAIEQGAAFISETFIFSVAGGLIFYEAYRSRKKASDQRDALADDITILQNEIEYIKTKLSDLNIKLDDYKVPEGYKPKYVKINSLQENSTQQQSQQSPSQLNPPSKPSELKSQHQLQREEQPSQQGSQASQSKPPPPQPTSTPPTSH
ncbi:Optic atrophy 3 protein (OPA3) family protein [Candida parapsilosis]|uniref:OPA3-like protein n=2 Tax=Candida parapsilosis TaxID=5480 RepID=G8B756_CANPC|nr:uncharacterized protein CPAR2_103270 [Candida parapsilosis]KAF6048264.1 Optic atrophy 3 protein (OPA3) family protein [Candida parapsilosis]KAF6049770.1 Optic atrophy 3 protein (OPA3) family protein [Candida parapsilosis]KAF6057632.1 Optic atrophy 3 protein (OPA3) family protein [Candida parapsilosis]KAF6065660.1 Optic atrophy 3 protein (OPA3) family protein [Candida parapsilosis]KAI5905988.1 OPA3-like protein [Candida parapsilosis]